MMKQFMLILLLVVVCLVISVSSDYAQGGRRVLKRHYYPQHRRTHDPHHWHYPSQSDNSGSSSSSKGKGGSKGSKGGSKGSSSSSSSHGKGHHHRSYPHTSSSRDLNIFGSGKGKGKGGSDDPDYIFRCTVPGTTDHPRYPPCPEKEDDSDHHDDEDTVDDKEDGTTTDGEKEDGTTTDGSTGTDSSNGKDCKAIASGDGPTDYDSHSYTIDFALRVDADTDETLQRIEDYLQENVAPALAGCDGGSTSKRAEIQNVIFDVEEDTDSKPYCDEKGCTNADINAEIYYSGSDTSLLESSLLEAIIEACDDFKKLEGVADTFDPCPTIQVSDNGSTESDNRGDHSDGDGTSGGVPAAGQKAQESPEDDGLGVGAAFGIAIAALALLALLALLVRRRRRKRDDMLKHQLFEDVGDDTFMLDGSPTKSDSMYDSMYPEGRGEGMILGDRTMNQDVHKCSSATCELCERRRQAGLQFLPSGGPLNTTTVTQPPSLDGDSSMRQYESEDTVHL